MVPLSVTIIALNEADRIGDAIASVKWADEVLVVDSGSSDGTVAVARELGARVIEADWPGYREQKNRAAAWAKHDWVFSLDSDEVVSPELAGEIQRVLELPSARGFEVPRLGHWHGAPIRHGVWRPDRSIRLFHKGHAKWAGGSVHERVQVDGHVGRLKSDLLHFPYRDVREHLATLAEYSALFVDDSLAAGRRASMLDVLLRPVFHLFKAMVLKAGYLDGVRGVCIAGLGAAGVMLKWGMLRLAQERSQ